VDVSHRGDNTTEVVKDDGKEEPNQETPNETAINLMTSEHAFRSERTPKHRSGEERILSGASKLVNLVGRADVRDSSDLEVQNPDADEGGDKRGYRLCDECGARRDVSVMGELEILSEAECVSGGDVAIGFEKVESIRVAGEPETTQEFCQYIEGDLEVSDGLNNADGDAENECEKDTIENDSGVGVGREDTYTNSTEHDGHNKNTSKHISLGS
jgi:hypothetical protein